MKVILVVNSYPGTHAGIASHHRGPRTYNRAGSIRHSEKTTRVTLKPTWAPGLFLPPRRDSSIKSPLTCATSSSESRPFPEVCKQISRNFYEACLPPLGVSYELALRSFASGCKEAYVSGASVSSINLQLQVNSQTGNPELDSFLSERGGLQADEVELRNAWLTVCYLTFEEANVLRDDIPASGNAGLDEERLGTFVRNVVSLAKQGNDANRIKLTEVLKMSGPDAQPRTDMESAVLSQAIRLVFCALDLCGGRIIPPSSPPPSPNNPPLPTPPSKSDTPAAKPDGKPEIGSKFAARKKAEADRDIPEA
mmetsp:Transcript_41644/g.69575  ORF Transcript_41644/g.69575 Transcript_41644/m.69575 type:complete len:309 (+) Transcript_41644:139-1065(+)|eukprot:CAMPEP_0198211780 /NCGR_PEP_ID=MMETSP1445-20131203/25338_1 /TAXON_ID=36898 /ORGANISM="Pyramimonas sp., Strain CCMP2087" /LENGTH=308 /DNA_ID=CAMNT_0043886115 /DNA_START=120 /DNA_END=1046 /DNA_ORIENTATION=-